MKKITFILVFLLTIVMGGYGQVTVGEATGTSQVVPFNPFFGYTYAQSIYLASEINASGSITSIQWYYNSTGAMSNSQGLTVYLAHTAKTSFDSNTDFVPFIELTAVYTGGIVTGGTSGWKTITFTTPFVYDGTSNLLIAVDENLPNFDSFSDVFRVTPLGANRSIYAYSDGTNTNPEDPGNNQTGFVNRGRLGAVPNIIFGGITQACANPTGIVASGATTTQVTTAWTAGVGQTEWEVYVVEQDMDAPTVTTIGDAVTGTPSYVKTGLTANTAYAVYVRAKCSETLKSGWSGPTFFRTLCDPFGDFTEDFTSTTAATGIVPNCWTKTVVSTNIGANVSVVSHTAASVPNAVLLANSADATAQIFLASPALTAIGANTHQMKFKARGGTAGQLLIVGTMSDATNPATFTPLQTITLTTTYSTYSVPLNNSTTDSHFAFKHGLGGTHRSVFLDDISWEPIPTAAPGCIEDINTVINEGCGNFATTFTWASVPGADGYMVSIGTSPNGGNLVVNNVNIFSVLSYSFVGNPGTTYYYTLRPYNAFGPATGCFEDSFTTYVDGCYCVALPSSNDGAGISNVQIANTNFPVTDVTYANFTENGAVEITQGINTVMNVTLSTSFNYFTNVWVDFNDNYTFEPSELVHSHVGPAVGSINPTIVNTSFVTPLTAELGEHRMRIVAADNLANSQNPCFSGAWAVVIDLLIDVSPAPACLPPASTSVTNITATGATLNWVSDGNLFNVETVFAGEPQGSGVVVSGIAGLTTTIGGLDPQTNYAYYIQRNCGTGSLSPWTGPYTFRTACSAFGSFAENFTTDVNITVPECWKSLINSSIGTPTVSVSAFNDYALLNNSSNVAAAVYLITPALTDLPLNTHRIKFKARGPVGTSIVVGTMSDPANESSFTAVQAIPLAVTFADFSVPFLNSTAHLYVAFRFVGTATFQSVSIDDVIWEVVPSCPDIYVVTFGGSTTSTADISWTPGGAETAWQYAYGTATLEDPSGLVPVDVTTSPSTTITGLAPSTTYKVWVRAACGSTFGSWSPSRTFFTACAPITTFPWTEGFEGVETVGSTAFPPCWSKQNGDWATAVTGTYNTPRTGTKYLRNSWSATNEFIWTPGFSLTAGVSYDFSFYMQGDGYQGWAVDVFHNSVQNSIGATQLGTTTIAAGSGTNSIQPYAVIANTFVPTTSGTYFFAIRVNQPSAIPWYIAFDDFRMEPSPTCFAPLAPTATNAAVTTATMNWIATNPAPAEGYDYYVSSDIETSPNATTVPTGTVAAGITTAELVGLTGATVYRIYVRGKCSSTDLSSWSVAETFSTECENSALPYAINFNVGTDIPVCTSAVNAGAGNNWTMGSNSDVGFPTNALRYAYHSISAANTWFYTNLVTLTAGQEYSISYDYGNDSTFLTEKLQVAYGTDATPEAMTMQLADHPLINQASLQSNIVLFTPTVSGDYYFGFNAYSDANQNNLYVDNISIQVNLSNPDFDNNSFTAYPNPVKDVLKLSYNQNISNVAVYNLLGQQVLTMNVNATKGQIDMSNLATGTYLVKVNTENAVKTIKVIKQ